MATAAATKKYEFIEPRTETVSEKDADTILIHLPEFRKEKLRVQLTSLNALRISGERETEDKIIRFQKEFPLSSNIDANKISAKFEKGILYIRQPKLITPEEKPTENKSTTPDQKKPANEPQKPPPQTNAPEPKTEDGSNKQSPSDKDDQNQEKGKNTEKIDPGSDITKPQNYQGNGVDLAAKLKNSRRAFYVVLVGIAAVGIGLYVTNFIRSFRSSEISG
ncbi:OLC1v1026938C1 [Oldenlandia corymbosa var. corymbosa]|uniref:OLC1v1026938C1 n=1 Tax=Oldenlandia corymbosa var. corymbosa TaxID=529605 RepID=A0AAV1CB13_OLDCO|nr:OLC1v1026938C1 [Oldenlandia corymbosa var. corymbosa]